MKVYQVSKHHEEIKPIIYFTSKKKADTWIKKNYEFTNIDTTALITWYEFDYSIVVSITTIYVF